MRREALRAAAAVAPDEVLAAVLALGVVGALVLVGAEGAAAVELEATRTHALEGAARVDAGAGRGADGRVIALVHVDAGVALAGEALGAGAGVAARRVGALVLAAVLARRALVQVHAGRAVGREDVARLAAAREAAVRVLAGELARRRLALVHVYAVLAVVVRLVALVAHAAVRPHRVDALAVPAQVRDGGALVDVLAVLGDAGLQAELLVLERGGGRAGLALRAPGGADGAAAVHLGDGREAIGARAALAAHQLLEAVAQPHVQARLAVGTAPVALEAVAAVGALEVHAVAVAAQARLGRALVHVAAVLRGADLRVAFRTDAHEGADQVLALVLAVVGGRGALVDIFAVPAVGCEGVPVRTEAAEGARHVVAAEGALVAHLAAFVHVLTNLHGARREAVAARALEATFHVRARAVTTNAALQQAFIFIDALLAGGV